MLVFPSKPMFASYYNYKINEFLDLQYDLLREEMSYNDYDLAEGLIPFFGRSHLRLENPERCLSIIADLYNWSGDRLNHNLSNLHLFSLYTFLCYMENLIKDEAYRRIYYESKEEEAAIDRAWNSYEKGSIEGINSRQRLKEYLQDVDNMIGNCFDDIDFITFPEIISDAIAKNEDVPTDLVGDFAELLPKDVLAHYREIHHEATNLFENINDVLNDIQYNLKYGHEYKLLWAEGEPRKEKDVHNYLQAILNAYFHKNQIQIDREVDLGVGRIDFRITNSSLEKVLIEVKLVSNDNLEAGLTKQLACYMEASKCDQACYLIFCFTDKEYERGLKFIEKHQNLIEKGITAKIFDARKRIPASKLR